MKYIVKVSYLEFAFEDMDEACSFAELAVESSTEEKEVSVRIIADKPETPNVEMS